MRLPYLQGAAFYCCYLLVCLFVCVEKIYLFFDNFIHQIFIISFLVPQLLPDPTLSLCTQLHVLSLLKRKRRENGTKIMSLVYIDQLLLNTQSIL